MDMGGNVRAPALPLLSLGSHSSLRMPYGAYAMEKLKKDPPDEGAQDSMCTTYPTDSIIAGIMSNIHLMLSVSHPVVSTLHKLFNPNLNCFLDFLSLNGEL